MNYLNKKIILILVIGIVGFLVIYLPYVKNERSKSIENYFAHPRVGDVYKFNIKSHDRRYTTFYYKIKDIGNEIIYFYPGIVTGAYGENDAILNHYDSAETEVMTKKELQEIRNGSSSTALLEIVRK